ncbi:MAG: 3'(2'),5'-bisphosphate nucleotidase CysQ, partial [Alphaproteobacteria bacterium]|nr:3'(2'),5'-bisphosphate nucleotidase CysQ [Alphaproteobacteria bacterium]
DDYSPVTDADRDADAIIAAGLRALTPDIPVITEEEVADGLAPTRIGTRFWLVDPLDGTREFIHHRDEFTVNIALIDAGAPVLGVVGVPARGILYASDGPGRATMCDDGGAHRPIAARTAPVDGISVTSSRSHANKDELAAFLKDKAVKETIVAGSSLKFCLIAEGKADLYPRFGPTMEWDTAAAHAVLAAAGGHVRTLDGIEFTYGKPGFRNPHFVASGRDDRA